jgi:hypothetical protein
MSPTLGDFITDFGGLIADIIPVIIGLAVLLFLWGLTTYILKQDSAEGRVGARNRMFWGVIIIFVMVSLWGFVALLDQTLNLDDTLPTSPTLPTTP